MRANNCVPGHQILPKQSGGSHKTRVVRTTLSYEGRREFLCILLEMSTASAKRRFYAMHGQYLRSIINISCVSLGMAAMRACGIICLDTMPYCLLLLQPTCMHMGAWLIHACIMLTSSITSMLPSFYLACMADVGGNDVVGARSIPCMHEQDLTLCTGVSAAERKLRRSSRYVLHLYASHCQIIMRIMLMLCFPC